MLVAVAGTLGMQPPAGCSVVGGQSPLAGGVPLVHPTPHVHEAAGPHAVRRSGSCSAGARPVLEAPSAASAHLGAESRAGAGR